MLFSIIIPVYNNEQLIMRSVKSIMNQSFNEFELILVDDGSTDRSKEIIYKLEKKYSNIKSFSKINSGPGSARNYGLEKASGEYVLFIDSDDELYPEALVEISKSIKNKNADIISFKYLIRDARMDKAKCVFNGPRDFKKYERGDIYEKYYDIIGKNFFPSVWNKIYKRNYLNNNEIKFDVTLKIGEDLIFNMEVLAKADIYIEIPLLMYKYYVLDNTSLSQKFNAKKWDEMNLLFKKRENIIVNNNIGYQKIRYIDRKGYFEHICMHCLMESFRGETGFNNKQRKNYIKKMLEQIDYNFKITDFSRLHGINAIIHVLFTLKLVNLINVFAKCCYYIKYKLFSYRSWI